MKQIDHNELEMVVMRSYKTRTPIYIWGPPGIGKSYSVRDAAKRLALQLGLEFSDEEYENGKFGFIDLRASQLDPTDLRGVPWVLGGSTTDLNKIPRTKWAIPDFFPTNPDSKGIIFLDEFNLAPPSIHAGMMQLVLDGRIGALVLPKGYMVIAAGNRQEDRANVYDLSGPLANRFSHFELKIPTAEQWVFNFATKNNVDTRMITFIQWKQGNLYKFGKDTKDKSFPTPRSVTMASRQIDGVTDLDEIGLYTAGACGEYFATEFLTFCKLNKKIDVMDILKNPETVKTIQGIDLKYCLIGCIADYFKTRESKDKKKTLDGILEVGCNLEPEFCMLLLRMISGFDENYFRTTALQSDKWRPLAKQYGKYFIQGI